MNDHTGQHAPEQFPAQRSGADSRASTMRVDGARLVLEERAEAHRRARLAQAALPRLLGGLARRGRTAPSTLYVGSSDHFTERPAGAANILGFCATDDASEEKSAIRRLGALGTLDDLVDLLLPARVVVVAEALPVERLVALSFRLAELGIELVQSSDVAGSDSSAA